MTCECRVCKRAAKLVNIGRRLPEYAEFVVELDSELESAETDAVYWRMKYEGTWPGDSPAARVTALSCS